MSIDYQELSGKLIFENGELKNKLSEALQEVKDFYDMVESEPNNMKLGKIMRHYYWDAIEKSKTVEEPPVWGDSSISRDNLEERLKYLNSELSHETYHDGWTVQGMREEKEWIESQLYGTQMELF